MQIATLNYRYNPRENVNGDSRAKFCHRHVLTTITNTQKKSKQRQSLHSKLSIHSTGALPPIKKNGQRRNSIRINGSGLTSSKIGDTSAYSFHHQSRSHSRQSNKSENFDGRRSRSGSIGGIIRPTSNLNRLKFGYPIKLRSAEFYAPDKSEPQLRFREDSFVNDSVRSAHHNRRSSIIPYYEALDDPHLRRFFQSPIVLDIVRKTLDTEPNNSFRHDERSAKLSKLKQRSKSNDLYDSHNDDYLRIVSKGSSGYAKLNGYDCIPSHAPARHDRQHANTVDPTTSSSQRWTRTESRLNQLTTQDKYQASPNTSVTSFPTNSSKQLDKQQKKKKTQRYEKSKQSKPFGSSSPLKQPVEHLVESTVLTIDGSSSTKINGNASEQKNEFAAASTVSQD